MDPLSQPNPQRDVFLRELERRSLDIFMIFNPTEEDYMLEWDKRYFRVPNRNKDAGFGKGKLEVPRYLMEKYAREMKNKLINEMGDDYQKKLVKQYEDKGAPFRDKFEENAELEKKVPRTSDPKLISDLYPKLVLGLVREWANEGPDLKGESMDTKTAEELALEGMNARYTPEEQETEFPIKSTGRPKKDVLSDVSQ